MRSFLAGIAVVQRFHPQHRCRSGWLPSIAARSGRHAFDRYTVSERQARDLVYDFARTIPDLDLAREVHCRVQIRVRTLSSHGQHVLGVRRQLIGYIESGSADCRDLARHHVDKRQLRDTVVIEERFVVRALQHVLIRADRTGGARALLHVRPFRYIASERRRSAACRYSSDENGTPLVGPLQGRTRTKPSAHRQIQTYSFDPPSLCRRDIQDP
jgi:hypothetical protein